MGNAPFAIAFFERVDGARTCWHICSRLIRPNHAAIGKPIGNDRCAVAFQLDHHVAHVVGRGLHFSGNLQRCSIDKGMGVTIEPDVVLSRVWPIG